MKRTGSIAALGILLSLVGLAACDDGTSGTGGSGGAPLSDEALRSAAVAKMHDTLAVDLDALANATVAIAAAAPTPPDRGWDPALDAAAISSMRANWIAGRTAYERIEGALAPLFPTIDYAIDARYDDFLTDLIGKGDPNLFDDDGVTGMHAVERVLFSDMIPSAVVDLESSLPGYVPASFPTSADQAASFKAKLCAKLVADVADLKAQWTPANIDPSIAFAGLVSLMNEQREKVQKASTGEEESRYSQRTMADLRDNLAGTRNAYAAFQPWLLTKKSDDPTRDGATIDKAILAGFDALDAAYAKVSGDAIPVPPATWSAENPTPEDRMTPFGQLFTAIDTAVDPSAPNSIVTQMDNAADALGLMKF